MIIVNKTKIPDRIMMPMVLAAMKFAGAHWSSSRRLVHWLNPQRIPVVFIVRWGKNYGGHGNFRPLTFERLKRKSRELRCDAIRVYLKKPQHTRTDPIQRAVDLFGLMVHEATHLHDTQHNRRLRMRRAPDNESLPFLYVPRWANRPHEIRAIRMEADAKDFADLSLDPTFDLACWFDAQLTEDEPRRMNCR